MGSGLKKTMLCFAELLFNSKLFCYARASCFTCFGDKNAAPRRPKSAEPVLISEGARSVRLSGSTWRLNPDPKSRERRLLPVKDLPVQEEWYELQQCGR